MMKRTRMFFSLIMLAGTVTAHAEQAVGSPYAGGSIAAGTPAASPPFLTSPKGMTAKQFHEWLVAYKAKRKQQMAVRRVNFPPPSHPLPPLPPKTYEEGQKIMLETAPAAPVSQDSHDAFQAMMAENIPMTPRQIVKMRQLIDASQRASAITPNVPPKSVSSTIMVNLAPGATPPAIRLAQGYVSSLVFVDSTGTPWPIAAFDIGNPKTVNMQWDGKSNILLIQAVSPYTSGDMVVRLVGLPTPITLELVSGQRVVDYRVDIHVSGIGPNTKEMPVGTDLPNNASQLLLGVLDGLAPPGSRHLQITGSRDTQAWMLGEKMYLRTRLTVLSPGWVGKMVSPDGMIAYELPRTSSVLVSRYGEPVQLKIEGF